MFVGVGVGPLSELTTSPTELPFLFHVVRSCGYPLVDISEAIGSVAELTVVGADHDEYGLLASEYMALLLSLNQAAIFDVAEYSPAPTELAGPA